MESIFLQKMGIEGWGDVEPLIISALLAGKAVMFEGLHGTGKTEIAKAISESFLGNKADEVSGKQVSRFRYFNCPIATQDELLGYLNLEEMKKGKIEYINTPTSVWGGHSILMDEPNRCSMGMQGKFMELALSGTVMGMPTGIEFKFAAVNPPEKYLTTPMDLALLSRFCNITVPSLKEIMANDKKAIAKIGKTKIKPYKFLADWKAMKAVQLSSEIEELIDTLLVNTVTDINTRFPKVDFSGRQVNDLRRVYTGFYQYFTHCEQYGLDFKDEAALHEIHAQLAMSLIPEATGLVNTKLKVDRLNMKTALITVSVKTLQELETSRGENLVLECLKDKNPKPDKIESLINSLTPDKWRDIRSKYSKNTAWETINNSMAGMSLLDELSIDNIKDIQKQLSLY